MRNYDYGKLYDNFLIPDVVSLIAAIHEYKGEQTLFIQAKADTLTQFVEIAKLQSTEASNKLEGIFTSDERLKKIVHDKTTPKTRSEKEIAGYRDVLATIHESHDFIPPKPPIILQLHRDLYKLGVIVSAYRDFSSRVQLLTTDGISKTERVKELIRSTLGKITKTEIIQKCPDISQITVQRALNEMVKNEKIIKISGGRYTSYT